MENIFKDYTQYPAPPEDTELAKWRALQPLTVAVPDWFGAGVDAQKINLEVNRRIIWTAVDLFNWQSPQDTLQLRQGDCMDISVLKYALLQAVGFEPDNLAIVLGEIKQMPTNQAHAWVCLRADGRDYVLDNKFDTLIAPNDYINWKPVKLLTSAGCQLFGSVTVIGQA